MMAFVRGAALSGLIWAWLAVPATAQAGSDSAFEDPLGYGFFQAGIVGMDLGDLNTSLVAAGLAALDENVPVWGGAGYGVVGRFHLGAVGQGGLDPAEIAGSRRIGLKGGYGLARARYQALSLGGLSLYPAVGLGAGGLSLQIADLSAPTFDEVLADPDRSATLSTGVFFLLNAGLGLDYRFQVRELEGGGGWGMVLGVEGGYMYTPGDPSWTLDGLTDVAGGPGLGIDGFYVWFSLGGWGRDGVSP